MNTKEIYRIESFVYFDEESCMCTKQPLSSFYSNREQAEQELEKLNNEDAFIETYNLIN